VIRAAGRRLAVGRDPNPGPGGPAGAACPPVAAEGCCRVADPL